jgi:hypothetical protein
LPLTLPEKTIHSAREQLFVLLWSVAIFCHYEWWTFTLPIQHSIFGAYTSIVLLPFAVLTLNRSILCLLLCCQLVDAYQAMPAIPNHWLLSAIISFLYLVWALFRKLPFETFQNALKWTLIAFYLWAVFWKTNSGFLDPQTSCAVLFMMEVPFFRWLTPEFAISIIPAKVLIVEALIPLLLLLRTAWPAVILGILFHLALAQNIERVFVNFSSVMVAGLIAASISEQVAAKLCLEDRGDRAFAGCILLGLVGAIWLSPDPLASSLVLRYLLWTLLTLCLLGVVWRNRALYSLTLRSSGLLALVGVFIVTANGVLPIIGTKTGSAWQMYSNLSIGAEHSNHHFISKSADIHGKLSEQVKVFYQKGDKPREMILHSLVQECEQNLCETVSEVRRAEGSLVSMDEIARAGGQLSWVDRKLFRYLDVDGGESCRW